MMRSSQTPILRFVGHKFVHNNANRGKRGCEQGIVLSGVSGRFPSSTNMNEFKQNLLNGVDMVTKHERWQAEGLVDRMGVLKHLDKFDADFFKITPKIAAALDPAQRILLEVVFEAIVDAGINPKALRGSKTGVFVGTLGSEGLPCYSRTAELRPENGYGSMGQFSFWAPNRVSYEFDLQGPSLTVSTACSSSLVALETAVSALRNGSCDAAIVAGACLHLNTVCHFDLMAQQGVSSRGKCQTFDWKGDGFARSEAVAALLLQKSQDAKRCYAKILSATSNSDGFTQEGISYPSGRAQERMINDALQMAEIQPDNVVYVEAHGTGTPAGDPEEVGAIYRALAGTKRTTPLKIGSVKSNMGHGESAAGVCSLAKVAVMGQTGVIPGNLHFQKLRPALEPYFEDGTVEIVSENEEFSGGIIGVSSFGLGGTNAHALLDVPSFPKSEPYESQLPHLIPMSGHSDESVRGSLETASTHATNPNFVSLVQGVFQEGISQHSHRGYWLGTSPPIQKIMTFDGKSDRPIWMVFSGMGCQWNEMGKDMRKIEAFAESMQRSKVTLKNLGIDLDDLLKPNNPAIFENGRFAIAAITAIQIALYDTLASTGIQTQGFIGHSAGESICAYADGCLSQEETLAINDARGRAFMEAFEGRSYAMASVGLSWTEVSARCPPTVFPACNNSASNVSIAGPVDQVREFSKQLHAEGVFVRPVDSCNMAPHTPYVALASDLLNKYASEIFQNKRPRSTKWLSTSIEPSEHQSELAEYCSVEYFCNNVTSPVWFHEAVQKIPPNAVVIEVAPRGLLQAILKESAPSTCLHIAPMHHKKEDKLGHFFQSIGDMYLNGVNIDVRALYPEIPLPVPVSTPFLGPLMHWNHETSWPTYIDEYPMFDGRVHQINLQNSEHSYLRGHKIGSKILFPATGYLLMAWKNLADSLGFNLANFPVTFSDVSFERATLLNESQPSTLAISLMPACGSFEIREESQIVVRGKVSKAEELPGKDWENPSEKVENQMALTSQEFYKELNLRGYNYEGEFRGLERINLEGTCSEVRWNGNWVTLMDTVLQSAMLSTTSREKQVPVSFAHVTIDPRQLRTFLEKRNCSNFKGEIPVEVNPVQDTIQCPGVLFEGVNTSFLMDKSTEPVPLIESYDFKLNFGAVYNSTDRDSAIAHMFDFILENQPTKDMKYLEILSNVDESMIVDVEKFFRTKPKNTVNITAMTLTSEAKKLNANFEKSATLISKNTLPELVPQGGFDVIFVNDPTLLTSPLLDSNAFIITKHERAEVEKLPSDMQSLASLQFEEECYTVMRKPRDHLRIQIMNVDVDGGNFSWLPTLQEKMARLNSDTFDQARLYLTSQGHANSGILGLFKCLRCEPGGENLRCILDPERALTLDFDSPDTDLVSILQNDLATNVVRNGKHGTYRHLPVESSEVPLVKCSSNAHVASTIPGDLSSLRWIEAAPTPVLSTSKAETCRVAYASLNFRDIMLATGKLAREVADTNKDGVRGFEFSGFDSKGNRVMGIMPMSMATSIVADPSFLFPVPDAWTLEDAATVPVVYVTAYYAMITRGRLRAGQSVLIHSGTGGVGQAAITLALAHDCNVFTTVGSPEKREYLLSLFPELKPENIGNSRDCSFKTMVKSGTGGRGVDLVLNSLAEEKLQASIDCVAVNGKFCEIGAFDLTRNRALGMRPFLKNIQFHGIFPHELQEGGAEEIAEFRTGFLDVISKGLIQPLPRQVFQKDQVEEAFRFMASGKHTGKVLIQVGDELQGPFSPSEVHAISRTYFNPCKSYVIVGGLGGFGLELANWMVERGARHLVLPSRSGVTTGYQALCLRKWKNLGVDVACPEIDLSDQIKCDQFFFRLISPGGRELGGIFNSSLVLRDGALENQTAETFEEVSAPKVNITERLDQLTRLYVPKLDYFVAFSSVTAGRGNAGQTSYGFANSALERICEERCRDGFHGLAIQWGVIGQVGFLASKVKSTSLFEGLAPQSVQSCLHVIDAALQQKTPICSSIVIGGDHVADSDIAGASLMEKVARIFNLKNLSELTDETKLTEIGMDSLLAIELKNILEQQYNQRITTDKMRTLTLSDIKRMDSRQETRSSEPVHCTQQKDKIDLPIDTINKFAQLFESYDESVVHLKNGQYTANLLIVHGMDGGTLYDSLVQNVQANCYAFRISKHCDPNDIRQIAQHYTQEFQVIQPRGPCVLAAYSAGGTIGVEMAKNLTKIETTSPHLVFLDGTSNWEGIEWNDIVQQFKDQVLMHQFVSQILTPDQIDHLSRFNGDSEEISTFLRNTLKTNFKDLSPSVMSMLEKHLMFLTATFNYSTSTPFQGPATLIKAKEGLQKVGIEDPRFRLQKNCTGSIDVFEVGGNHSTFLQNPETFEIINRIIACIE